MPEKSQESHALRPIWAWIIIFGVAGAVVGWGLLNYAVIRDPQRHWNFGQLPDTPGESIYSTEPMKAAPGGRQIELPPQLPPSTQTEGGQR
jgi:hypothetical protein